jgi:hypothetical protein
LAISGVVEGALHLVCGGHIENFPAGGDCHLPVEIAAKMPLRLAGENAP